MPALGSPDPIVSVGGTWAALRWPTHSDLLFALKATIAVVMTLVIAFREGLQNPYWSALTIYVLVSQPQAGAVRSKAFFRLTGTLLGGIGAMFLAGVFGGDVGALLVTTVAAIVLANWAKVINRTPASYIWFVIALTFAVVDIAQAQMPSAIFAVGTARMVEIGLAVVMIGLVDSILLPRPMTPDFLKSMSDWRDRAAQWAAASMPADSPRTSEVKHQRRNEFDRLAAFLGPLYGLCVQLPWDIVAVPPRGSDLRLLRLTLSHLIAAFAAVDALAMDIERVQGSRPVVPQLTGELQDWLLERPALDDPAIVEHAGRGDDLHVRVATLAANTATGDPDDLLRSAAWLCQSELIGHWSRLDRTLHAVATGTRLPAALRQAGRQARPAVSTDYVLGFLDASPMALALGFLAVFWFFTGWNSSLSAMLFAVIALGFVGGAPGALRGAQGVVVWIMLTCGFTLVYQFVILPRVTDFPVLVAVLVAGIIPLTIVMTMSPAGLLIIANGLAAIALQNDYAADFQDTLENLSGALAGCLIAVAALHLPQFDRARFSARRLGRALRRDFADTVRARAPNADRIISLAVDRVALRAATIAGLPEDDPLRNDGCADMLRVTADLLRLRTGQPALTSAAQTQINVLRAAIIFATCHDALPDFRSLSAPLSAAVIAVLREPPTMCKTGVLASLTGLRAALAPEPSWRMESARTGA